MNWKFWTWAKKPPATKTQPLVVNPGRSRQLVRAIGRLQRVEAAIAKGDDSADLKREAEKLRHFINWAS